jgi:hypothetical protein
MHLRVRHDPVREHLLRFRDDLLWRNLRAELHRRPGAQPHHVYVRLPGGSDALQRYLCQRQYHRLWDRSRRHLLCGGEHLLEWGLLSPRAGRHRGSVLRERASVQQQHSLLRNRPVLLRRGDLLHNGDAELRQGHLLPERSSLRRQHDLLHRESVLLRHGLL